MASRVIKIEDAVKVFTFAVSLLGFLSVARNVELSYAAAFALLFLLSISFEYRRTFPLPRWLLAFMAVCVILLTGLRINADEFIPLVVGALAVLLAIKLLGTKAFRDYMQIYLIALFLLIGSALLSMDIEFLFYFIGILFLVTAAMVFLSYISQDDTLALPLPAMVRIASKASLITLIAIPVTIVMFLLLPRTGYPLFHFLNTGPQANVGFTDSISLGKVSDIQEDTTVILRAGMEKVGEELLYWRGIVLDYFDGTSWTSRYGGAPDEGKQTMAGRRQIRQTIYLEPYGNRYLFALDKPTAVSLRYVTKTSALTYALPQTLFRRLRYESVSALSDVLPEQMIARSVYLQVPDKDLARTRELAKALSSRRTPEETAQAVLRYLRDGEFRYSLKNLPLSGNPLEDFLFRDKYGNCEYFASSMAVILRMAGIPARLVGGYRGGYYNEAGEYYLVPQKNAHVWVEAYVDGRGWLRMDPTPAGIEHFVPRSSKDILFKVKLLMDSLSYYWNAMVINYDFSKQALLFQKLRSGLQNPRLHFPADGRAVVRYSAAFLLVGFSLFLLCRLVFRRRLPYEEILNDFRKNMERCGYMKKRSEGLEEFAARIREEDMRARAFRFVQSFQGLYYRDRKLSKEEKRKLRLLIKAVRDR